MDQDQPRSLEHVLKFAKEKTLSWGECAELLEIELMRQYPHIQPYAHVLFDNLRSESTSNRNYCSLLYQQGQVLSLSRRHDFKLAMSASNDNKYN